MNVGYCGLGKLGFPVSLATEAAGHNVWGYDPYVDVSEFLESKEIPYTEKGVPELLHARDRLYRYNVVTNPFQLVQHCDLIFVPVQTPHDKRFEGDKPMPSDRDDRADFDYSFLKSAVADLAKAALWQEKSVIIVIISTVLPGTIEREIKPLLNGYTALCYNPYFIAMGTTVDDYLDPEFVLLGTDDGYEVSDYVENFYATIHDRPVFTTNIETAELIKVAYNTFISLKIGFANTMMEICEKTNADVDDLAEALSLATERVVSPKYLRGGMGDGGGCHPRDNIAMSWLAKKLKLRFNIFEDLMHGRQLQSAWLVELIRDAMKSTDFINPNVVLLGEAYKPETNLTVGSPAKLLSHDLNARGIDHTIYDPFVDGTNEVKLPGRGSAVSTVYFISTNHKIWAEQAFPQGSVVIDPWGYIPDQEGVEVIRVGRKS